MAVIGIFTRAKDGGWEGWVRTLTRSLKVRLVPNDDRTVETAPDFHVRAGGCDLGAAWLRRTAGDRREYLSVQLDDPVLVHPIRAALFFSAEEQEANLVWRRDDPRSGQT